MFHPVRTLRRRLLLAASTLALTVASVVAVAIQPAYAAATGGSGASLAYTEVQAESSATNGTIIGPSYTQGQLADEASGRKAVTLAGNGSGQYVTFTTPVATNSIDIRYSIPDSADGSVYTSPLSLYIDGTKQSNLTLTNAYSWYYGSYPFTNTPGSGNPHHFYDEVHRLLPTSYPAGTTFKLEVDSGDTASSYTVDLADFEQVPAALSQPSGSVSVVSEGADSTGVNDSTAAFNAAISAAGPGGTVWIPPGTYNIPGHITVNNVTIAGAGMWYSTITGTAPGFYGNSAPNPSTNVHLQNFAISGNVQERCDSCQVNGIGGAMSNSTVSNIWIEHMKVGAWMDGPMTGLTFSGMRIRDTTADGINLHGGVTNSTITDSDVRNTGDDGIALWADSGIGADSGDTISNNTVQLQQLANGIAIYGGNNNTVSGNLVVDTGITQGGGIQVGQRFSSTPVGLTTISNNTMIRDGDLDPNWQFGVGALWFDGSQGAVSGPINVTNALIEQSPYEAVQWVEGTISGVNLSNVSIIGTGTFALQEQTGGAASLTNVTATGVAQANEGNAPSYSCEGGSFAVTDGGGNSGVLATQCNGWPPPVYPPYPGGGGSGGSGTLTASPTSLSFGSVPAGTTSGSQSVTVTNTGGAAAAISSISAGSPFAETNNCGSSLAAGANCTVTVTFAPTTTGSAAGTLTVASNATNPALTVALSGTGTSGSGGGSTNLALGAAVSASSYTQTYVPANAVDGNTSTYWESSASWPSTFTVNLGGLDTLSSVVIDLPPSTAWSARTQTLSVLGSANGSSYSTLAGSASYTFNPSTGNTVTIPLPSGTTDQYIQLSFTANSSGYGAQASEIQVIGTAGASTTTDLARGAAVSASSHNQTYVPANAVDGNTSTYWESTDGTWPSTITVNLGAVHSLSSVTIDLPPSTAWSARTQTLSVLGSANGSSYTTLAGSNTYTFNPSTGNTVTIPLPSGTSDQYVELSFTANSVQNGAQASEILIYGQ
jgi:alpha-1,3-glucanase-like protein/F5/8 type C domain-containing protein/centrosomal CEP192-like protein